MAHEPILILDNDPVSQAQLTDILNKGGYDVYGVRTADKLMEAVKASPFPCVILDVWIPNVDRVSLLHTLREVSPNTAVIFVGEKQVFPWLLEIFREGAADFLLKPFDPIELRQRIDEALSRRDQRSASYPAISSTTQASMVGRRDPATEALLQGVKRFHDQCLEIFLELERRNLHLERKITTLEHPSKNIGLERKLVILVADPDATMGEALKPHLKDFRAEMVDQIFTGGEVLDHIGELLIDLLVVGRDLPDIPAEIVADGVHSQSPNAEIIIVDDWASRSAVAHIVGDELPARQPRPVPTDESLLELVQERCRFIRDREEARKIAQMFKSRHHDYLRALADIRGRIDKVLK
jgi:DNA-binding NtrC family response regulator